jgi:hypothetical protein
MSAVGVMVGLTFIVIGVTVIIKFTWAIGGPALWFTLFWTAVSASITIFHALNAFSKRGVAFEEVQFDAASTTPDTRDRLAELERLRADRVISDPEYQQKRAEILKAL